MKLYSMVVFDDQERETLVRALQEHGHLIAAEDRHGNPRAVVRSFLHRVHQEEPLDRASLDGLLDVIQQCIARLEPETAVEWWRDQGAPGGDDAIEGLAATRRRQVKNLRRAENVVSDAIWRVGEAPPTRRERIASES